MLVLMGRPSKGERDAITAKPYVPLGEVIRRNAKLLGMTPGDYMVALTAHALGMPDQAPKPGRLVETLDALELLVDAPLLPSSVVPIGSAASSLTNAKELSDQQIAS